MSFTDCISKGSIRADTTAPKRVTESIKIAERFLEEAKGNMKMGYFDVVELLSYNAVFHGGRTLLFSNGYTERSHACLVEALKALHPKDHELQGLLKSFDQLRLSRHNVQYGGALVDKESAETYIKFAAMFVEAVKKRL